MKEKRIFAMFITSAVTLIASLAVTFGVLMTLADPVVATGVVRYDYAFNAPNDSLISNIDEDTLKLEEDIVFQPSSAVIWGDTEETLPVWFNGSTYEDEIVYADESISTKIKVIPFRLSNNYARNIRTTIEVTLDSETSNLLESYTFIKIYNYEDASFEDYSEAKFVELNANSYKDFAIVVYADDSSNIGKNSVNWGTDYQKVNVVIANIDSELLFA